MRIRITIIAFLCLFLIQCSSIPSSIKKDKVPAIKKVGCISLLGDKISWVNRAKATRKFPDTQHRLHDWNVDAFVKKKVAEELQEKGTIQYVDVSYDPESLDKVYTKVRGYPYWGYDIQLIQEKLTEIVKADSVDAIILVIKSVTDKYGLRFAGYGVCSYPYLFARDTELFVLTRMVVLDAKP